ncbi:hypothetical protein KAR91_64205 [Candidatus Pacearchaeota archaeon]|nr:hypothetical protein [Candidatus Pacearchaeota archaeon]
MKGRRTEKKEFPHGNYFKVPNEIFGIKDQSSLLKQITPIGFVSYALILRRYDYKKQESIYESHASMADRLGISKTSLEKYLSKLRSLGFITRRVTGGRRNPQWVYEPFLPLPSVKRADEDNTNRPADGPKKTRIDQMVSTNRPNDEGGPDVNVIDIKPLKSVLEPPNRLSNRLNKNMCIEKKSRRSVFKRRCGPSQNKSSDRMGELVPSMGRALRASVLPCHWERERTNHRKR